MSQSSKDEAALPPMICAVCQRVLDLHALEDGLHYRHAFQDETPDHEPVPTTPAADWTGARCDFCNEGKPTHELPARDFRNPIHDDQMSIGNWAACDDCADMIRRNAWPALAQRALDVLEKTENIRLTADERITLLVVQRELHRRLREAVTGPLRPIKQ